MWLVHFKKKLKRFFLGFIVKFRIENNGQKRTQVHKKKDFCLELFDQLNQTRSFLVYGDEIAASVRYGSLRPLYL
jgi:hypothetical protein